MIVEPATLTVTWTDFEPYVRTHERAADARKEGLSLSCCAGVVSVDITGADGSPISRYHRGDNVWHDLQRGDITGVDGVGSCSCGDVPSPGSRRDPLGWYWLCRRCGAGKWSHEAPSA